MPEITLTYTQANLDRILAAMTGPVEPTPPATVITVAQLLDHMDAEFRAKVRNYDEKVFALTRTDSSLQRN